MSAAALSLVGVNSSAMRLSSQIANCEASVSLRNLPRRLLDAKSQNANMEIEKNGGPNFLADWREFRGLTQKDVANAVRTSEGNYSDLEAGKRGLSLRWLRRLSKALDVPAGVLADHPPGDAPDNVLAQLAEAVKPPQPYIPNTDALASVLAVVLRVDASDPVKQAELRIAARGVSAGIRWLAKEPARQDDPDYLAKVRTAVAEAIESASLETSQG